MYAAPHRPPAPAPEPDPDRIGEVLESYPEHVTTLASLPAFLRARCDASVAIFERAHTELLVALEAELRTARSDSAAIAEYWSKACDTAADAEETNSKQLEAYARILEDEAARGSVGSVQCARALLDAMCHDALLLPSLWLATELPATPLSDAHRLRTGISFPHCSVRGNGGAALDAYVPGDTDTARANNVIRVTFVDEEGEPVESVTADDVSIVVHGGRVGAKTVAGAGCVEAGYTVADGRQDPITLVVSAMGVDLLGSPWILPV